jgi:hypothetical protein
MLSAAPSGLGYSSIIWGRQIFPQALALMRALTLTLLDKASGLEIIAKQSSRIAIIGGENIGHRYVWWNFVSSRKPRIEQARQDWAEGRFPQVPGDEAEFIPLPEK